MTTNLRSLRLKSFLALLVVLLGCGAVVPHSSAQAADKPNILIIISDDMGYGDLGCMGSKIIKTPNLDALAKDGMLCRQGYVPSSVCAPSRAGLITGRYPVRIGFESNLPGGSPPQVAPEYYGLAPTERTLADHLKHNGYRTGAVGKWHLGGLDSQYPTARGVDYFCGLRRGSHSYWLEPGKGSIERNGERVEAFSSRYATDFFSDEAIGFIDRASKQDKPWFLYLAYTAPHTPMQATEEDLARYAHVKDAKRRTYCAMMHALDRGVGRVVEQLKTADEYENTLIVFFSDNGGARSTNASWNGPLSGSKGTLREGGIRVPMIFTWPDKLPSGKTYASPVNALDLLPTFMAACGGETIELTDGGGKKQRPRTYDGINLLPYLSENKPTPTREMFWRLQGQTTVIDGNSDKLIRLSHKPAQFFKLANDPGEQEDLTNQSTSRVLELYELIHQWESSMPTYPHFYASPHWQKASAISYDNYTPAEEPR